MDTLREAFEERLQEIEAYLDLLEALERQVRDGRPPQIGGAAITAQQQRILYSSVYLQLYNLIEATVTWCVEAVTMAATGDGTRLPGHLAAPIRREWVRVTAKTHAALNPKHRLDTAVHMCDQLVKALPVLAWAIEKGNAGNWDDTAIEAITKRLGCALNISTPVYSNVKRKIRDDKGPLALVRDFRNRLAHGSLSFTECGDGITVVELREIKDKTALYLREVVASFRTYIDAHEYLTPDQRPAVGDVRA